MDKILGIFCFSANFQRLACIVLIDQFNCRIPYFTNLCLCVLLGSFFLALSFVLGTFCIGLSGWFVLPVPDSRGRRTGSAAPSPERVAGSAPASPSPDSYRTTPPHPSYRLDLHSEQMNEQGTVSVEDTDAEASFTRTVNTVFVSGSFDLFDVMCKQCHKIAFNPIWNGTRNGDFNGTCKQNLRTETILGSTATWALPPD